MLSMLIIAIITSLYMAWNIGANDVANSMGTSVGSGALTLKKAVIIAGVFEFLGAFLVGKHVTNTISNGIVNPALFELNIFAIGMLSSLIAASLWVTIATYLGLPVSTTQSIVGAIMGFSAVLNIHLICWGKVIDIVTSWIISPLSGALVAYIIFLIIKKTILSKNNPIEAAKNTSHFYLFYLLCYVNVYNLQRIN